MLKQTNPSNAGGAADRRLVPPGPEKPYDRAVNLLDWIGEQIARFGDIVYAEAFGGEIYIVNNPTYAQHVLRRNWTNYRKGFAINRVRQLLGPGLMASEGDFWISQRKLIQPAFHRSVVERSVDFMKTHNGALLDRWAESARRREVVNVTRDTSRVALEVILTSVFGADCERVAPKFQMLSDDTSRTIEFAAAFNSLRKVVAELVAGRRSEGCKESDLLGMMMALPCSDGRRFMSDRQLVNEVMTTIVAGHETTASTLNWTWYLLSQHPEERQRIHDEAAGVVTGRVAGLGDWSRAPRTRQVLEEALRLYPAGWLMTRRAMNDDKLGEYFVPAGTEIYISPYFMQRNAEFWDNPDRFDPDRFSLARSAGRPELAMLPFSAGPRNCIGELFARIEMQIHVLTIAKSLRLDYDDTRRPEHDVGVNLRSKRDFIMRPRLWV